MKTFFFILFASLEISASAQTNDFQKAYNDFRNQAKQKYEDFRKTVNEEYAAFVRNAWIESKKLPTIHMPIEERIKPIILKDEDKVLPIDDHPIDIDEVIDTPIPQPQPKPVVPIYEQPLPTEEYFSFILYGTEMRVRANNAMKFQLKDIEANTIASIWEELSTSNYDNLIRDCLENRIRFQLSDWAYLRMLSIFCESFLGSKSNEAELLKAYLYCQSGYQMRLAISNNHLVMLYASQFYIFEKDCCKIDDTFFFADNVETEEIQICNAEFPNEQALSMQIAYDQKLRPKTSKKRTIASEDVEWLSVSVSEDENLMDFYQDYPSSFFGDDFMTRWAIYANTPLSESAKEQLYPTFKEMFNGLANNLKRQGIEEEMIVPTCVDMLCHWVQTGFVYEYDDKVWGRDRAFFSDETLFYPYCDCEDRSIILTRLVRDLLGLKCALVYYPGHLATAIALGDNIKGDYIRIDGTKYIICDPTYIGASIGMTMPDMDNQSAKVIVLR